MKSVERSNVLFIFVPGPVPGPESEPVHGVPPESPSGPAEVESLILACALGAVNSGADIRLRLMDGQQGMEGTIHDGYVAPRAIDLEWADLIVFGLTGFEKPALFGDLLGWIHGRKKPLTASVILATSPDADGHRPEVQAVLEAGLRAAGVLTWDGAPLHSAVGLEDVRSEAQKLGACLVAALHEGQKH